MSSFVESSLTKDEKIVLNAKLHWALFIGSGLTLMIGLSMSSSSNSSIAGFLIIIGGAYFIKALMIWRTTELALTNKRVISKWGIIRRRSVDTNLSKIEGVSFHQGIFGRLLGYGSVVIRGTGGDHQPVPFIRSPILFKNAVNAALDAVGRENT